MAVTMTPRGPQNAQHGRNRNLLEVVGRLFPAEVMVLPEVSLAAQELATICRNGHIVKGDGHLAQVA
jgi:hypothetical protein